MKGRPIDQLVYEHMHMVSAKLRQLEIPNFQMLLERHLIPEVRQEVQNFYGHLDTQEAKYPGLDYNHPIHRIRLSRWTWHRRLFRALDQLRLTPGEIASLTKWEGTKWAKERFEREQNIVIRDTASDDFSDWVEPESPAPWRRQRSMSPGAQVRDEFPSDESDDELEHLGADFDRRLRGHSPRPAANDPSASLDEEWEQWLKNAIEAGELSLITEQLAQAASRGRFTGPPHHYAPSLPGQSMDGHQEPGFAPSTSNSAAQRRTYSSLRLPGSAAEGGAAVGTGIRVRRTAQPRA